MCCHCIVRECPSPQRFDRRYMTGRSASRRRGQERARRSENTSQPARRKVGGVSWRHLTATANCGAVRLLTRRGRGKITGHPGANAALLTAQGVTAWRQFGAYVRRDREATQPALGDGG